MDGLHLVAQRFEYLTPAELEWNAALGRFTEQSWLQLATPTASGWRQMQPGVFVCSNEGSADWYLFQCTELANCWLYER